MLIKKQWSPLKNEIQSNLCKSELIYAPYGYYADIIVYLYKALSHVIEKV